MLATVYLVFNAGYGPPVRVELCGEDDDGLMFLREAMDTFVAAEVGYDVTVGNGEGQVSLAKLPRHLALPDAGGGNSLLQLDLGAMVLKAAADLARARQRWEAHTKQVQTSRAADAFEKIAN